MVMETPGPQEVGREFVRQYYTMLHEAPLHLHRFYSNNSAFVHGGIEKAGSEQPPIIGQEAIHKKIISLNFNDCHAKIRQVDAQATVGDSVVVQVTGELSNNREPMRRFMQTFVLVPQTPKKFYVHNDIFRYQDEVFHEEEAEVEETENAGFVTDSKEEVFEDDGSQEPASINLEAVSNYYDQLPVSNGASPEAELLKVTEPAPVLAPPKPQLDVHVAEQEVGPLEETFVEEVTRFEQRSETKPAPAAEPPQSELHEPRAEAKPVTWAALASKNASSGVGPGANTYSVPAAAPVSNTYSVQTGSHASKPPPSRSDPARTEGSSSYVPQNQRAPRPPRERPADRDRSSVSRVDSDGDNDSNNGRYSNSVGSRFPDNQQLFVGNLPHKVTERDLKKCFEQYGKVEELRINTKSNGGKVPNFGFVVFESAETVQMILSLKETQPIKYNGEHRLNVEEKKPRSTEGGLRGGNIGRGGMSRGGGQGYSGRPGGQTYTSDQRGPGGRGGYKAGGNFTPRQDMRGSSNLGPRGALSQQGRR